MAFFYKLYEKCHFSAFNHKKMLQNIFLFDNLIKKRFLAVIIKNVAKTFYLIFNIKNLVQSGSICQIWSKLDL
jgi:hypothetical protein